MILSILFSPRQVLENMFQEHFLLIWSQQLLMRFGQVKSYETLYLIKISIALYFCPYFINSLIPLHRELCSTREESDEMLICQRASSRMDDLCISLQNLNSDNKNQLKKNLANYSFESTVKLRDKELFCKPKIVP